MMALNNARSYGALLTKCQSLIQSKPEWLTPRLFCGLAFNGLGNTEKAKEMLHDYDSRTGPRYDDNREAWKQYGGPGSLVGSFAVVKPLTSAQLRRLPADLRDRLVAGKA